MMPEIVVSEFAGDLEAFKTHARSFFKVNEQYRGYDKLITLCESLNPSDYELFQVTCDEVVAGVAAVKYEKQTLYFDIFTVDPEFRGIGVGDSLFSEIVSNEKFVGVKSYESMALPGDRSTKNFFEQRKGKARLLIVGGLLSAKETADS